MFCRPVSRHWSWIWRQSKRRSLCCWKNIRISLMSRWLWRSRSSPTGSAMLLKDFSSLKGYTDFLTAYIPWVPVLFLIQLHQLRLILLSHVNCHAALNRINAALYILYSTNYITLHLLYTLYWIYPYGRLQTCLIRHLISFIIKVLAFKMATRTTKEKWYRHVDNVKGALAKISPFWPLQN